MNKDFIDIFINDDVVKFKEALYKDFLFKVDEKGESYLHYAAFYNSIKIASFLIECGSPVNIADIYGFSPLHVAVKKKANDVLKILINIADINQKTKKQFDALMLATWFENSTAIDILLKAGISYEEYSFDGWGAVHYATWKGDLNILQKFFDYKKKFDYLTKSGLSIVDIAFLNNKPELAGKLIMLLRLHNEYKKMASAVDVNIFVDTTEEGLPKINLINKESKIIFGKIEPVEQVEPISVEQIKPTPIKVEKVEIKQEKIETAQTNVDYKQIEEIKEREMIISEPTPKASIVSHETTGVYNNFDLSVIDRYAIEEFIPNGKNRFRGYSGQYYPSMVEMMIANFLFVAGFDFEYQRPMQGTVKIGEKIPTFTFYDKEGDVMIWISSDKKMGSDEWNKEFLWYQGNGFNYEINFFVSFDDKNMFDCLDIYRIANLLKDRA